MRRLSSAGEGAIASLSCHAAPPLRWRRGGRRAGDDGAPCFAPERRGPIGSPLGEGEWVVCRRDPSFMAVALPCVPWLLLRALLSATRPFPDRLAAPASSWSICTRRASPLLFPVRAWLLLQRYSLRLSLTQQWWLLLLAFGFWWDDVCLRRTRNVVCDLCVALIGATVLCNISYCVLFIVFCYTVH